MSDPVTQQDELPRIPGAGTKVIAKAGAPDERIEFWVAGDTQPRIILDIPNGQVLVGNGSTTPAQLTGTGAAFTQRGLFNIGTTYAQFDLVNDAAGNSYSSRAGANVGHQPTAGASDANWQLLSAAGTIGGTGNTGPSVLANFSGAYANLGATHTFNGIGTGLVAQYEYTLNADCAITLNPLTNEAFYLFLKQDGTGGRVVNFIAGGAQSIIYAQPGGAAPVLVTTASNLEILFVQNDGTNVMVSWMTDPLVGPGGPKGDTGTPGAKGDQGDQGPPGTGSSINYGNGADGAVTFSTDGATKLGLVPVANVYTMTRDIYPTTMTVDVGVTIITNGYSINAKTSVTVNGTIHWDGGTATLAAAPTASVRGTLFTGGVGIAGGIGAGANGGNVGSAMGNHGGAGGGSGASGGNNAGGTNGAVTAPTAANKAGWQNGPLAFTAMIFAIGTSGTMTVSAPSGGSAGGAGAGDGTNSGGASGSGGNIVLINSSVVTVGATGIIRAAGGGGGNATAGNCGGGGGGGGGYVLINTGSYTNAGTVSAPGGTGGTKLGTGVNGTAGTAGAVLANPWT